MMMSYNPNRFDDFCERWGDKRVRFKLFGEWREGRVTEVMDTVCAPMFIVAELREGSKQIKVGAPYQAFRRIADSAE